MNTQTMNTQELLDAKKENYRKYFAKEITMAECKATREQINRKLYK